MLSIERIRKLIPRQDLTDHEAERIRDELRTLAEILYAGRMHRTPTTTQDALELRPREENNSHDNGN